MRRAFYRALDRCASRPNHPHQPPLTLAVSSISIRRNHDKHQTHTAETSSPRSSPDSRISSSRQLTADPNVQKLVHLIRSCSDQGLISHGQQLHCYALRTGFLSNVFISTALVGFNARLVSCDDAHKLFDEIPCPNVVTWNTMISGYLQSGADVKALALFVDLNKSKELAVDGFSLSAALSACGQLRWLQLGMSLHSNVVAGGFGSSNFVANCLIDMYGKCSSLGEAILVFDVLVDKDAFSWNSVVAACVRNYRVEMAMEYFHQMPNPDIVSYNELINGIAQSRNIEDAVNILLSMPNPNSSSWNTIITAYVNRNRSQEALDLFAEMHRGGVEMDEYTFSSILSGIAHISSLPWGMLLHSCAIKHSLDTSVVVGSALVDMYAKCGKVEDAETIFCLLPVKNTVTWNAMLSGFAHNGESNKVISSFEEELKNVRGLKPNEITFLNVLAACSHNDMPLEMAYGYFSSMITEYGIRPLVEHLTSMIRIMGQHGEVWRAEKLIHELGFGSCGLVWRALLGACGACGDLEVAMVAAAKVAELEGDDDYAYVTVSNIRAERGKWLDANQVREMMRMKGVVKEVGRSWIAEETP